MKSLRRLFTFYKPYRGRLILSQFLLLVFATALLGTPTLAQRLINKGILAHSERVVLQTGMWMLFLALVSGAALAGAAHLAVFFAQGTGYAIRTRLYRKLQTFSFANFDRFRTGNIMVRLNADVNNVVNAVQYLVLLALNAPFMIVVALVLTIITTPHMIWVLVVVSGVVIGVMAILIPQFMRAYDERQAKLDDINNTLQENLAGVRVVKAFGREELEMLRFSQYADALRTPASQAAFRSLMLVPFLAATSQLGTVVAVWAGGAQIFTHSGINVGELVTFTQYLALIVAPLSLLAIVFPFAMRGNTSARRIFEIYDTEPLVEDRDDVQPLSPETVQGRIVFENVSFAFQRPDGTFEPPSLKNINLTIEPGEQVGFLGATGAGKSSLVNLIPRFYDVTEGRVTIDGMDVRDIPLDTLRQIVGVALQEALLFQGKIYFNLKYGNPNVSDDVMIGGSKAADAYGFITNLPEQWDAPVTRRGYNFSGGQRQRLSMSRSLITLPRILILDDSTSALDAATEARVQASIPEFTHGITTLYVAQRISAVIDLDKIVLLESGEIVDMGSHEELLARNALYQGIYESQLGSGITAGLEVEV